MKKAKISIYVTEGSDFEWRIDKKVTLNLEPQKTLKFLLGTKYGSRHYWTLSGEFKIFQGASSTALVSDLVAMFPLLLGEYLWILI